MCTLPEGWMYCVEMKRGVSYIGPGVYKAHNQLFEFDYYCHTFYFPC